MKTSVKATIKHEISYYRKHFGIWIPVRKELGSRFVDFCTWNLQNKLESQHMIYTSIRGGIMAGLGNGSKQIT